MNFKLVRNGKVATILILIGIVALCVLFWHKAKADETPTPTHSVVLRAGSSFGPGGSGPVLGLDVYFPQGQGVDIYAGTLLWGQTPKVDTNWDWHTGLRACRWKVCGYIGASYLQVVDKVDGSHTNFNLGFSYQLGWHRVATLDYAHLSNAGTIEPNLGRNAALIGLRLQ